MSVHVFFITLAVNYILALITDEDTPILTEFEPSDWVIKNFGAYLAIKRNNTATDVIGDNRRYDSPYDDPYYHYYHYHHHPPHPHHIFHFPQLPIVTTTPATNALIFTNPKALSLICEVTSPFEHISWTLYKCPQKNYMPERVQLTSGSTLFQTKYYDVTIGGTGGKYSSTLNIKDINPEETAGLYRCDGFPVGTESGTPSTLTTTDYFIIGKKTALQDCFIGATPRIFAAPQSNSTNRAFQNENTWHETVKNFISTVAKDEYREPRIIPNKTFQYILKIPFNTTKTQEYKIRYSMKSDGNGSNNGDDTIPKIDKLNKITFNATSEIKGDINQRADNVGTIQFNKSDVLPSLFKYSYWNWLPHIEPRNDLQELKAPESQKLGEIPIQNSSYVRFDFTGGEKIQNWATVN